ISTSFHISHSLPSFLRPEPDFCCGQCGAAPQNSFRFPSLIAHKDNRHRDKPGSQPLRFPPEALGELRRGYCIRRSLALQPRQNSVGNRPPPVRERVHWRSTPHAPAAVFWSLPHGGKVRGPFAGYPPALDQASILRANPLSPPEAGRQ